MRILTNDPSFTAWGWAVIEIKKQQTLIVATGCIKTEPESKKRRIRKSDDTTRRICNLVRSLETVILEHKIDFILGEAVHGSQNAQAAIMMGATTGILQTMASVLGIPIEWYSEADAKKALTGTRSLSKPKTIQKINSLYTVQWSGVKYRDEAVADAIAIFHCALINSEILRYFKLQQQTPATVFTRIK